MIQSKKSNNTMYTLHTNHIGSIEKISDKNGNIVDSMSYTPFGQRGMFSDWSKTDTATHFIDRGFTGQQHLDNFALINFNGRMYDPVLAHFLSPDPYIQNPENPLNHNRYSYCLFSPLQYVDPSGEVYNPIFDWQGNFLGTDDRGIQGEAIIMNATDFVQNMDHFEALKKGTKRSDLKILWFDLMNKIDAQTSTFPNRPDWDGVLTKEEADAWWNAGTGAPLYVDLSKINIPGVTTKNFSKEKQIGKNFLWNDLTGITGTTYGSLTLTLLDPITGEVKIGNDERVDRYKFDMQKGRPLRNIATFMGRPGGTGVDFNIIGYGTKYVPVK